MRGRNKITAKLRRKQKNVIDEQLVKLKEKQQEEREALEKSRQVKANGGVSVSDQNTGALSRFSK